MKLLHEAWMLMFFFFLPKLELHKVKFMLGFYSKITRNKRLPEIKISRNIQNVMRSKINQKQIQLCPRWKSVISKDMKIIIIFYVFKNISTDQEDI